MKKVNQLNKIEVRDELYLYIDIDTLLNGTLEESAKKILELKDRLKKECPAFDNGSTFIASNGFVIYHKI